MNFEPLQDDSGKTKTMLAASGASFDKGDPLEIVSGYVDVADSTTSAGDVSFVALEGVDSASEGDEVLCLHVAGVEFKVTEDSGSISQSDVGTKSGIGSSAKFDLDAGNNCFHLTEVVDSDEGVGKGYFIIS